MMLMAVDISSIGVQSCNSPSKAESGDDVNMEENLPRSPLEETEGSAVEYKKCLKEYLCAQVSPW